MSERGSYSVEMSLVISIVIIVIGMLVFRFGKAFDTVLIEQFDPEIYQEAFFEKIEELRIEKIMKEKR